jgi:hypothetical protein
MVGQQFKGDMGSDMSGVHFAVQMRNSYDSVTAPPEPLNSRHVEREI